MDYLLNNIFPALLNVSGISNVLNLIINGLPSKQKEMLNVVKGKIEVLNLIINGLPSKLL